MIKIVDKKRFTLFVLSLLLSVGALSFMVIKAVQTQKKIVSVGREVISEKSLENIADKTVAPPKEDFKIPQNQPIAQTYGEYNNQQYAYAITFPDTWHVNADSSETKLVSANIEGKNINAGGQTFWSNYKNISDFSPENKPVDFHLLGLTIYEVDGMNSDDLAVALGFDQEAVLKKTLFEGQKISGIEYVAVGEDEKNPQVMIVFQKGQRFYVFNLGFIGGDIQAAEIMEGIVKTLSLKG